MKQLEFLLKNSKIGSGKILKNITLFQSDRLNIFYE